MRRTTHVHPVVPFRWTLSGGGRLPDLARVPPSAEPWPGYRDSLLALTARVVSACGETDPVFVGRSCESIFDLLGGLLAGAARAGAPRTSPAAPSPRLLLVSIAGLRGDRGLRSPGLRANLAAARLDPAGLLRRSRPATLVDIVASGETFQQLLRAIKLECRERRLDWRAVRRKLRLVALRSHPETRERDWQGRLVGLAGGIRQVGVPARLWRYLADHQPKVTPPHAVARWHDQAAERPPGRAPERLAALRAAVELAGWGRDPTTWAAFARHLRQPCGWPAGPPRPGWPERRRLRAPALDEILAEYRG